MRSGVKLTLTLLPAVVFACVWQYAASTNPKIALFAGSPVALAKVAGADLASRSLYVDIATTGAETALGLFAALAVGLLVSVVMWWSPVIRSVIAPYLTLAGAIPIFALAPLLVFWFGVGITAKSVIAFASCVILCIAHGFEGLSSVSKEFSKVASGLGAGNIMMLRKVVVPGALSALSITAKSASGLALIGAFIGEFISSTHGLGHYTLKASQLYDAPRALFGVILLAGVGFTLASVSSFVVSRLAMLD